MLTDVAKNRYEKLLQYVIWLPKYNNDKNWQYLILWNKVHVDIEEVSIFCSNKINPGAEEENTVFNF